MQQTYYCPKCQAFVSCGAQFCQYCGNQLYWQQQTPPTPTYQPPSHYQQQYQGEEILADVAANLFRGAESVGGRMKITNQRLLFEPHAINIQNQMAEIPLIQIAEVRKRNSLGIVPNGILIRTKSGIEYKFVVWSREHLINLIQSHLPQVYR